MALSIGQHQIGVEIKGQRATVADNDIAKLMYYLNCVCYTIGCNNEPEIRRFTNYSNWSSLSVDEQRQLFVLCYTFSPDAFDGKVCFQNDALCGDRGNEFYKISQVSNQLMAVQSIFIAGRIRRVNRIMTYTMPWMRAYYLEPMRRQAQRFARSNRSSSCVIS